jgi:hypothetical protein
MIDEKYFQLMNEDIDGTIEPGQRLKLQEYLSGNSEAQILYDDLLGLSQALAQYEKVDPPIELKQAILRQVRAKEPAFKRKSNFLQYIFGSLAVKKNLKYAYSLSAGIAIGIFIFALVISSVSKLPPWDFNKLTGSFFRDGAIDSVQVVDQKRFTIGNAEGTVKIRCANGAVIVEIDLTSTNTIAATISFDNQILDFEGMRQQNHIPKTVEIGESQVRLTEVGDEKYSFLFKEKRKYISTLKVHVQTSDNSWEETLFTRQRPN